MPNLNRVMLMGNLTRDPELRFLPNNTPVVGFGLAVNRKWKDKQGQYQEETTFVDVECWGVLAELANKYLSKGRPVYLDGRLKLDQWKDKDGSNRSKMKVVMENMQFLGGGDSQGRTSPGNSAQEGRINVNESDIPF